MKYWESPDGIIYHGNVLEVLKEMPSESVQVVCTSPPYWGLRDYNLEPQIWDEVECVSELSGIKQTCNHVWGDAGKLGTRNRHNDTEFNRPSREHAEMLNPSAGQFCQQCNAWRGSLGLEPNPELYIKHMVEIFRQVKRVLRSDGSCWVNMGSSYCGYKGDNYMKNPESSQLQSKSTVPKSHNIGSPRTAANFKPKDLIPIPWMLAMALQADGWWLRSGMPWIKRSAMPESVTDRPASALEYMFLFSKSQKYYFDMDSIRKPQSKNTHNRYSKSVEAGLKPPPVAKEDSKEIQGPGYDDFRKYTPKTDMGGRNFRNTDLFYQSIQPPHGAIFCGDELVGLDINPQAEKAAHFACFPPKIPEVAILAGTSEKGCCVNCGAPWERVVDHTPMEIKRTDGKEALGNYGRTSMYGTMKNQTVNKTTGWKPTCRCLSDDTYGVSYYNPGGEGRIPFDTKPCTVLDPFLGAGTSALVAYKHGRKFVGIELSKKYLDEIAIPRIKKACRQMKLF